MKRAKIKKATKRKSRLIRASELPPRDIIAIGGMLARVHAAIALVPGDPMARTMTDLLKDTGIYRKDANSFTAREGGDPLTPRGKRIFSLIPDHHRKEEA